MPVDVAAAVVGWIVEAGLDRLVAAGGVRRKFTAALSLALDAVLAEVDDDESRSSLRGALAEHFGRRTVLPLGRSGSLTERLTEAVRSQLAPLADPANALGGRSYLDHIGVDGDWLTDRLVRSLAEAIQEVATLDDFGALATRLGLEDLRGDLDRRPLAAGRRPPFLAPRLRPDLVERPGLAAELVAALTNAPPTTPVKLVGGGGYGKTTLAA
ncbi:MAG TPA: hypothetical protein VIL48_09370 [Acidimicrobiales bacterium]